MSVSRKRGTFRIEMDILDVITRHQPINPTRIMYKVNIGYMQLLRYLHHLERIGHISKMENPNRKKSYLWTITEIGLSTLYHYRNCTKNMKGGYR